MLCWRRFLKVPWKARRRNHSILKEINPEYSLEGLILQLKLQYFCHLMRRTDSLGKILMLLGKIQGKRRREQQKMRWHHRLDGHESEQAPGVGERKSVKPGVSQSMGSRRVGHHWAIELKWLTDLKNKGWKLTLSLEYGTTTRFHRSLLTLFFGYTWKVIN